MSETRWEFGQTRLAVVIVFEEKTAELTRLQARSLERYLDPGIVSEILYLNNAQDARAGQMIFTGRLLPEFDRLADRVKCLPAAEFGLTRRGLADAPLVQQALRLEIARRLEAPFYLLLDAAHHFIAPVDAAMLFSPEGLPRSQWASYQGYQRNSLNRCLGLFGHSLPEGALCLPAMAPAVLVTALVRDLLAAAEAAAQSDLIGIMRSDLRKTEFLLYSAFASKAHGEKVPYAMGVRQYATLFIRWPQAPWDVMAVLNTTAQPEVHTLGVEPLRYTQLTPAQIDRIVQIWVERRLFSTAEEGRAFIAEVARNFPLSPTAMEREEARNQDVLAGRNNRLFINRGTNRVLEQHCGDLPMSPEDVRRWRRVVEIRSGLMQLRGGDFAMMIAPDTHAIHREDLPELDGTPQKRPILQILDELKDNPRFHYPLEAIRKGRGKGIVCHTADSHWSGYGAWLAYKDFLQSLPFRLEPPPEDRLDITDKMGPGDLGNKLIPVRLGLHTECFVRDPDSVKLWDNGVTNRGYMAYWRSRRKDLPRGMLFMDSYGWKLQKFLAESFSELFIVHTPGYEWDMVEAFAPDIIISEMAERFMNRVPNDLTDAPALPAARSKAPGTRYPTLAELRALTP